MLASFGRGGGSHNLEKIRILTSDEYNKLLGINVAALKGTLLDNMDEYEKFNHLNFNPLII